MFAARESRETNKHNTVMSNIAQALAQGDHIAVISLADLREFALSLMESQRKLAAQQAKPEEYLTSKQAAAALNVCENTLWRWNRDKYLCHVKVGKQVMYRASDIERLKGGVRHA